MAYPNALQHSSTIFLHTARKQTDRYFFFYRSSCSQWITEAKIKKQFKRRLKVTCRERTVIQNIMTVEVEWVLINILKCFDQYIKILWLVYHISTIHQKLNQLISERNWRQTTFKYIDFSLIFYDSGRTDYKNFLQIWGDSSIYHHS